MMPTLKLCHQGSMQYSKLVWAQQPSILSLTILFSLSGTSDPVTWQPKHAVDTLNGNVQYPPEPFFCLHG